MRLDKFLCESNQGTRSQVKGLIRQGLVTVNGAVIKSPEYKVTENRDCVALRGAPLQYQCFQYFMLNKPKGVVSATQDNTARTVLDLLSPQDRQEDLFPVGRLDKDTEGLLLVTNDGELTHRLLSPKRHVDKTYLVGVERPLLEEAVKALEQGVDIGEKRLTAPAQVRILKEKELLITIHEGKFHQVKRMLQAVDNRVIFLKRISFGGLFLDESLEPGTYRALTEQEVTILHENSSGFSQS